MKLSLVTLLGVAALLPYGAFAEEDSTDSTDTADNTDTDTRSDRKIGTADRAEETGPTAPIATFTVTSDLDFYQGTRTGQLGQPTGPPTGPYTTYTTKITLSNGDDDDDPATSTYTGSFTFTDTATDNGTATDTSVPQPTNSQPCNGYVELCSRKYSNITQVGCHNSPFVRPGNSGSNQELPVQSQLNDGVRFLQAQIQFPANATEPHFCHTSCDLLDAGPITEWLGEVTEWVAQHPYDVVTILLGNGNYSHPDLYVPYIEKSGILKYVYKAPFLPMALNDWPSLEDMILRGQRVVMFLDYIADQRKYPWLLDEFSQMWETPFDPLDRTFPCTVQRPPDLSPEAARNRLYLINHNLNAQFNIFGAEILVPAVSLLNETNNATGYGSLGESAKNCRSTWGRAPNVLNVDYYNYGNPPGSVFEAAAMMNNVTYDWNCCGIVSSFGMLSAEAASWTVLLSCVMAALML